VHGGGFAIQIIDRKRGRRRDARTIVNGSRTDIAARIERVVNDGLRCLSKSLVKLTSETKGAPVAFSLTNFLGWKKTWR
jgi:hypothetical protein